MARKANSSEGPGGARNFKSLVRRAGYMPRAFEGNAEQYDERTREVLDQDVEGLDAKLHPTIIDLRSLPSNAAPEEILQWTAKWLNLPLSDLKDDGKTESSRELYRMLNQSMNMASDYLRGTLRLNRQLRSLFPPDGAPPELKNHTDLVELLMKTVHLGEEKTGLSKSALYCGFVAATVAGVDSQKHRVGDLIGEARYLEHELTAGSNDAGPLLAVYDVGASDERKFSGMHGDTPVKGTFVIRGKAWDSFFTKWLSRPETSAETALKDGIAMRLTVPRNDFAPAAKSVIAYLQERYGAYDFKIEDDNMFDPKKGGGEFSVFETELRGLLPDTKLQFAENEASGLSGGYQALKIVGRFEVPRGGTGSELVARRFEVLLVLPYNKNERKGLSHYVYDVVRKVSVMTRLFGACEESIYDQYVAEASRLSGMDVKTIEEALVNDKNGRLVEHKGKTRQTGIRYVAPTQYARRKLLDLGDDPAIFSEILREDGKK